MKRPSLETSNTEKHTRTPVKRLFSYYTRRVLWLLGIMNSLDKQGSGNVPWEGDFLKMWTHGKNKLPIRVERQHCSCTLLIYFGNLWQIQQFTYQWFIYAQSAVEVMIRWTQKLPNHDSLFMWSRVLTSALTMLHSLHTQFTNCLPTVHQLKNAVYIRVCVCVHSASPQCSEGQTSFLTGLLDQIFNACDLPEWQTKFPFSFQLRCRLIWKGNLWQPTDISS